MLPNIKKVTALFSALSRDSAQYDLCLQQFVLGLATVLKGSVTDKMHWTFRLYNIKQDGHLTREVRELLWFYAVDFCDSLQQGGLAGAQTILDG